MADDRQDLLNAINEFLDCSIVIPPSEVEGKDLLKSIATFQKLLLRKRKEREQKSMKEGAVQEAKGLSTHIWAKEFVPNTLCALVGPSLAEPGRGVSRAWLLQQEGGKGKQDGAVGSSGSCRQGVVYRCTGAHVQGALQVSAAGGRSPQCIGERDSPRVDLPSPAQALPSMHLQSCVK